MQWVFGINQEFLAPRNMSRALYFRDNGRVGAKRGCSDNTAGEAAANNTFDNDGFVEADLASCMMDSQATAEA